MVDPTPPNTTPRWMAIVGVIFLGLAVIFLMGLLVASIFGYSVPSNSRFLVCALLALCAGIGSGFLGGSASASGAFNVPRVLDTPIKFGVTGGIAVLVIVLVLCHLLYRESAPLIRAPAIVDVTTSADEADKVNVAITYQPESIPAQHKLYAEVATDENFKHLARPRFLVDNPNIGQLVLSLPKSGTAKYWVRMVVDDPGGQKVAVGDSLQFTVSSK